MNTLAIKNILTSGSCIVSTQQLIKLATINHNWHDAIMGINSVNKAIMLQRNIEQEFYFNIGIYDKDEYLRNMRKSEMCDISQYVTQFSTMQLLSIVDDMGIGLQYIAQYTSMPIVWNFLLYTLYKYIHINVRLVCPIKLKTLMYKYRCILQSYINSYVYDYDLICIIPMVRIKTKYLCCVVSPTGADLYDKDYVIIDADEQNIFTVVYELSAEYNLNNAGSLANTYNSFMSEKNIN